MSGSDTDKTAEVLPESPADTDFWSRMAPHGIFASDLVLTVHHILTEPVCPTATVRFEQPDRAGHDVLACVHRDSVEEAVTAALAVAKVKLAEIVTARQLSGESTG